MCELHGGENINMVMTISKLGQGCYMQPVYDKDDEGWKRQQVPPSNTLLVYGTPPLRNLHPGAKMQPRCLPKQSSTLRMKGAIAISFVLRSVKGKKLSPSPNMETTERKALPRKYGGRRDREQSPHRDRRAFNANSAYLAFLLCRQVSNASPPVAPSSAHV